ncbi:MAG TPA: hypothetical protein VIP70_09540 [Nitrososphaeraceae archaeon]
MEMFERNRTKPFLILYALYLYFLGLGLRSTSKALERFVERNYVAVCGTGYKNSIQKTSFHLRRGTE